MAKRSCLAIILAAGEGTRMKSAIPKVLHKVGGLPMLGHVLKAAEEGGASRVAVVVEPGAAAARAFIARAAPAATLHIQPERLGTAHAVLAAKKAIAEGADDIVVVFGDTPLITARALHKLRKPLAAGADLAVAGCRPADPTGYGRLIMDAGRLVAIREEKDASPQERKLGLCNGGIMAFRGSVLLPIVRKIGNDNQQHEFYLTDAVALAVAARRKVEVVEIEAEDVIGVNARSQLAEAEAIFQERRRAAAMADGATLIAPETVWFSYDTRLGKDVTVEPNVFFGPGVTVADNVVIRANSHIEGARIAAGAVIGPFARLRPGADIRDGAHIGNFVEVKNALVGKGAKANHLTYIGDAHVGANSNIGAGTITCNYDGFDKHHTEIGEGVFVGSNSALVAPVRIGAGAHIAAGSVIVRDVPPDALAIARGQQVDKPGWAKKYREHKRLQGNRIERRR